ncbi:ATP-dependent protease [Escherichia phage Av-05]|uniref:ATP-dependent protease subunit n=1 Tax=Escherichia phage Av-05 TaxID=1527519 RepID=A0A076G6K9_9CAUD|nr:ATP-dependent protease [Escherichia phage Av-05]AII27615.1 ATP-dependent protease subunit [Escherichia phage Av-05]
MQKLNNGFDINRVETSNVFTYRAYANNHVVYVNEMHWLEDHQERLQTIRAANPEDTVRIIINTLGGDVAIAMAYVSAIRESQAMVIVHAEGQVCSAGTVLWLACERRTVSPLTIFMFHNYQGWIGGDGSNIYRQAVFQKDYFDRVFDYFYKDVLTPEEMETIKGGGEVWLTEEDILVRTEAALLDKENIRREQQGLKYITGPKTTKPAKSKSVALQNIDIVSEDELQEVPLNIAIGGENFSFNMLTLNERDFDGFNVEELKGILVQLNSLRYGESETRTIPHKRDVLLNQILGVSEDLLKEAMEKVNN